jgi:hypothetical protein
MAKVLAAVADFDRESIIERIRAGEARARAGGAHMVRRPRRLTSSAKLSGYGRPPPCDRRLSRKTRAAVGKPPGSTIVTPAVSSADSPGAICLPSGHYVNAETTAAVAFHMKLAQHRRS